MVKRRSCTNTNSQHVQQYTKTVGVAAKFANTHDETGKVQRGSQESIGQIRPVTMEPYQVYNQWKARLDRGVEAETATMGE